MARTEMLEVLANDVTIHCGDGNAGMDPEHAPEPQVCGSLSGSGSSYAASIWCCRGVIACGGASFPRREKSPVEPLVCHQWQCSCTQDLNFVP